MTGLVGGGGPCAGGPWSGGVDAGTLPLTFLTKMTGGGDQKALGRKTNDSEIERLLYRDRDTEDYPPLDEHELLTSVELQKKSFLTQVSRIRPVGPRHGEDAGNVAADII